MSEREPVHCRLSLVSPTKAERQRGTRASKATEEG